MILEGLDRTFCKVSTMNVWRGELKLGVVFVDEILHCERGFVVKDVCDDGKPTLSQQIMNVCVGNEKVTGGPRLKRFCQYCIAVLGKGNHNVPVAFAGHHWQVTRLIREKFAWIGDGGNRETLRR